jgi:hypothetical protein
MAKKLQRKATWLDVAVTNAGLRRGIRALDWAYSWAVVRAAQDGREPTVEEVAEWWGQPRRTAFRDQADFRAAFPNLDSPAAIYASPEAQEMAARHAAFGKKVEDWATERKKRKQEKELSSLRIAQLPAD